MSEIVLQIQTVLRARGHDLGATGPNGDGVDGEIGDRTLIAIAKELGIDMDAPFVLRDPPAFFDSARDSLFGGRIKAQSIVDGITAKIAVFGARRHPIAWAAYEMATSYWETGRRMQPVREIGRGAGRPYGKPGRNGGQIAYGRGDVQLTWDDNYEAMDRRCCLQGALIADYDLALDPTVSAQILVFGMEDGIFTKGRHKLADYLPTDRLATRDEFRSARPIVNGTDRADEIAGFALDWQKAFQAGGWGA